MRTFVVDDIYNKVYYRTRYLFIFDLCEFLSKGLFHLKVIVFKMPRRKRRQPKRRKRKGKKRRQIKKSNLFSKKFKHAMFKLNRLSPEKRRLATIGASNVFIRDITSALKKIRKRPHLVKGAKHRKVLKKHRKKLRRLVNPKLSINKKRHILTQVGGIVPFLIPVLVASIGAAGTAAAGIGGAAVHAAVSKS